MAANFVGVLVASLKAEIAETSQRGERLSEAVAHNAGARETAAATLDTVRAQRARREARGQALDGAVSPPAAEED